MTGIVSHYTATNIKIPISKGEIQKSQFKRREILKSVVNLKIQILVGTEIPVSHFSEHSMVARLLSGWSASARLLRERSWGLVVYVLFQLHWANIHVQYNKNFASKCWPVLLDPFTHSVTALNLCWAHMSRGALANYCLLWFSGVIWARHINEERKKIPSEKWKNGDLHWYNII